MTEPSDWRLTYDPQLSLREALHRMNGGAPRTPEQVAAMPPAWEVDINLMYTLIQFQRDAAE